MTSLNQTSKINLLDKNGKVRGRIENNISHNNSQEITIYPYNEGDHQGISGIKDNSIDNYLITYFSGKEKDKIKSIFVELLNKDGVGNEIFVKHKYKGLQRYSEIIKKIDTMLCDICSIPNTERKKEKFFIERKEEHYYLRKGSVHLEDMFIGDYYMYYPSTEEKEHVRRAVVNIYKQNETIYIKLKNINNAFRGVLEPKNNSIFASLDEIEYSKYKIFLIIYSEVHTSFDTLTGLMSSSDRGIATSTKIVLVKEDKRELEPKEFESYDYISKENVQDSLFQKRIRKLLENETTTAIICDKKPRFSKITDDIKPINRTH